MNVSTLLTLHKGGCLPSQTAETPPGSWTRQNPAFQAPLWFASSRPRRVSWEVGPTGRACGGVPVACVRCDVFLSSQFVARLRGVRALCFLTAPLAACLLCPPGDCRSELAPVWVVPDELTFLHALSEWSPRHRFPIFIRETPYLDMFLSRYGSDSVIYAQPGPLKGPVDREMLVTALLASWREGGVVPEESGGTDREAVKSRHRELRGEPGVVLAGLRSEELYAGLALASGHIQLFDILDTRMEGQTALDVEKVPQLRSQVEACLDRWQIPYGEIGDSLDYLTLAIDLPLSYGNGFSVDDSINRCGPNSEHVSFYVGRLLETEPGMSLYQAMCSLFLPSTGGLFLDAWPSSWERSLRPGYWELSDKIPALLVQGPQACRDVWNEVAQSLGAFDWFHLNSFGDAETWGDLSASDIPQTGPSVVLFCHNASAEAPWSPDSLAGTWLRKGAFLYFGALSDPLAGAFPASDLVYSRLLSGVPVSAAVLVRDPRAPGFSAPWRLALFGDPLFRPQFACPSDEAKGFELTRLAVSQLKQGEWQAALDILHRVTAATGSTPLLEQQRDQAWQMMDRIYQAILLESFEPATPPRTDTDYWADWWRGSPLAEALFSARLLVHREEALTAYRALLTKGAHNAFERQKIRERIAWTERLIAG